jgi:hypothetical protein
MAESPVAVVVSALDGEYQETMAAMPMCLLDTVVALAVLAVAARCADDENGAALAAARLVGRHCELSCGLYVR